MGTSIEGAFKKKNTKNIGVGIHKNKAIHHSSYIDYQRRFKEQLNEFTIFTIIRDPFERVISDFHWFKPFRRFGTIDDYLNYAETCINTDNFNRKLTDDHMMPQHRFIIDADNNICKNIIIFRMDRIEDIREFLQTYGLELFHEQKSNRPADFQLTELQKIRIRSLYDCDFTLYNESYKDFQWKK